MDDKACKKIQKQINGLRTKLSEVEDRLIGGDLSIKTIGERNNLLTSIATLEQQLTSSWNKCGYDDGLSSQIFNYGRNSFFSDLS